MAREYSRAVAMQILKAIDNGDTSRDAIAAYVREQLAPLNITVEQIEAAAHGVVELWETLDRAEAELERRA